MGPTATIILAVVGTGAFTELLKFIFGAIQRRRSRKNGKETQLDRIEKKVDDQGTRLTKLEERDRLQYLSLMRLTVMDSDMPMSERLIAGQEYLDKGGNGDVKKFYEHLKARVDGEEADSA